MGFMIAFAGRRIRIVAKTCVIDGLRWRDFPWTVVAVGIPIRIYSAPLPVHENEIVLPTFGSIAKALAIVRQP